MADTPVDTKRQKALRFPRKKAIQSFRDRQKNKIRDLRERDYESFVESSDKATPRCIHLLREYALLQLRLPELQARIYQFLPLPLDQDRSQHVPANGIQIGMTVELHNQRGFIQVRGIEYVDKTWKFRGLPLRDTRDLFGWLPEASNEAFWFYERRDGETRAKQSLTEATESDVWRIRRLVSLDPPASADGLD